MKKTRRTSRVGENVRDALVQVLRDDLKGIDVGWVSISEVEVSPDLHYARVYMTGLEEEATKKTVDALRELAPKARHFLGRRIHLRFTPELDFRYDETSMRASRIELLLSQVIPPNPENAESEEEGEAGEVEETGEDQ